MGARTEALPLKITPTPLTAALAGLFSALTWPLLWKHFGQAGTAGSVELIAGTLLLVALPAHALVLGFGHHANPTKGLDTAMLKRICAWLAAAGLTVIVGYGFSES
jgi:hypothetical protein